VWTGVQTCALPISPRATALGRPSSVPLMLSLLHNLSAAVVGAGVLSLVSLLTV